MASLSWPPRERSFSKRVTWWPRTAATRAASIPAGPPPTIATRRFRAVGVMGNSRSMPARAFTVQRIVLRAMILMQRLQEMHRCISRCLPSAAFTGHSGSAIRVRPRATKSTLPACTSLSAKSGSRILPTPITGILTAFLMACASSINAPWGKAMGGCSQVDDSAFTEIPAEMSRASTPSCSSFFAIRQDSSISRPPATYSCPL